MLPFLLQLVLQLPSEEHPVRRCGHKQAHDTLVGDITLLTEKLMSDSTGLSGSMLHDDVNLSTHTPGSHFSLLNSLSHTASLGSDRLVSMSPLALNRFSHNAASNCSVLLLFSSEHCVSAVKSSSFSWRNFCIRKKILVPLYGQRVDNSATVVCVVY